MKPYNEIPSIFSSAGNSPVAEPLAYSRASLMFFRYQALQTIPASSSQSSNINIEHPPLGFFYRNKTTIAAFAMKLVKCRY